MINIRASLFETNSSSSHALDLIHYEDFEKWKVGTLLYKRLNSVFLSGKEGRKANVKYLQNRRENLFEQGSDDICLYTIENIEKYERGELDLDFFKIKPNDLGEFYVDCASWLEWAGLNFDEVILDEKTIDAHKYIMFGYFSIMS